MNELLNFIKENILSIIVIIVVVFILLVIIDLKDINLNPPKPDSTLVQQVTVETLETMNNSIGSSFDISMDCKDNFCKSYLGKASELELECNKLTKGNCGKVNCCVYSGKKCVAGNKNGPTFKTDKEGKLITADSYYYHLGKCHGLCPT